MGVLAGGEAVKAVFARTKPVREATWNVILPVDMSDGDCQTIQAVLDGDLDRYAELVVRYQQPAIRLAFAILGNHEDAKDATQDAFVRAYRSLRQFRGGAKFSTWLYRIVVNACHDMHRRRARQPSAAIRTDEAGPERDFGLLFADVQDPTANPGKQLAQRELAKQISAAIGELPIKQRSAFVLHHIQGLALEEVAETMRCRLGTVKAHVFRACESLRRKLGPQLDKEEV